MKTLPIITYPFYDSFIDGRILKRTTNKQLNDNGEERPDTLVTRSHDWDGVLDWEIWDVPSFSGDIIGKVTGKYRIEYGFKVYEVILFNHIWSKYGFPIHNLEYRASDNGYYYEMVPDTGDVVGFVVKDHGSRDFTQSFYPHFDPDYRLYSETEKWDNYFKSTVTRIPSPLFDSYGFVPGRNKKGFNIEDVKGTRITALFKPFYDGGQLMTHGLCLSKTEQLPTKSDILHTSINPSNPVDSFNAKFIEIIHELDPDTDYFARLYMKTEEGHEYYSDAQTFKTTVATIMPQYVIGATTREVTSSSAVIRTGFDLIGDFPIEEAGIVWKAYTSGTPVLPTITTNDGKLTTDVREESVMDEHLLTGLSAGTKYYVRTYVKLVGIELPVYGTSDINEQPIIIYGYRHPGYFITDTITNPINPTITILRKLFTDSTKTTVSGKIIGMGGAALLKAGVCWSPNSIPTKANSFAEADMSRGEFAEFYCDVIGLQPETTYHFRTWATTKKGATEYTGYSADELIFNTATGVVSKLTYATQQATEITSTSAKIALVINDKGGLSITESGICYKLNSSPAAPTVLDSKKSLTTDIGRHEAIIESLAESTTYKARSYVTTSEGTEYGNLITFTTLKKIITYPPSITTDVNIIESKTTATVKAYVTNNGGAVISRKGFAWSTAPISQGNVPVSPYQDITTENIEHSMTGLTEGTKYYVRAYAINEKGIGWGNEVVFETLEADETGIVPVITNLPVFELKTTSSVLSAKITSKNGTITRKGIAWSTSSIPATTPSGDYKDHSVDASSFSVEIKDLSPETLYYVRAYAQNETGFGWSEQFTITTPSVDVPVVATNSILAKTNNSITIRLTVSRAVIDRGIAWGYSPLITPNKISYSGGSDPVDMKLIKSDPGVYYVRAYFTTTNGDTFTSAEKMEVIAGDNLLFELPDVGDFYSFNGRSWMKDSNGVWYRSDNTVSKLAAPQSPLYASQKAPKEEIQPISSTPPTAAAIRDGAGNVITETYLTKERAYPLGSITIKDWTDKGPGPDSERAIVNGDIIISTIVSNIYKDGNYTQYFFLPGVMYLYKNARYVSYDRTTLWFHSNIDMAPIAETYVSASEMQPAQTKTLIALGGTPPVDNPVGAVEGDLWASGGASVIDEHFLLKYTDGNWEACIPERGTMYIYKKIRYMCDLSDKNGNSLLFHSNTDMSSITDLYSTMNVNAPISKKHLEDALAAFVIKYGLTEV